jgi:hypothetical protein
MHLFLSARFPDKKICIYDFCFSHPSCILGLTQYYLRNEHRLITGLQTIKIFHCAPFSISLLVYLRLFNGLILKKNTYPNFKGLAEETKFLHTSYRNKID